MAQRAQSAWLKVVLAPTAFAFVLIGCETQSTEQQVAYGDQGGGPNNNAGPVRDVRAEAETKRQDDDAAHKRQLEVLAAQRAQNQDNNASQERRAELTGRQNLDLRNGQAESNLAVTEAEQEGLTERAGISREQAITVADINSKGRIKEAETRANAEQMSAIVEGGVGLVGHGTEFGVGLVQANKEAATRKYEADLAFWGSLSAKERQERAQTFRRNERQAQDFRRLEQRFKGEAAELRSLRNQDFQTMEPAERQRLRTELGRKYGNEIFNQDGSINESAAARLAVDRDGRASRAAVLAQGRQQTADKYRPPVDTPDSEDQVSDDKHSEDVNGLMDGISPAGGLVGGPAGSQVDGSSVPARQSNLGLSADDNKKLADFRNNSLGGGKSGQAGKLGSRVFDKAGQSDSRIKPENTRAVALGVLEPDAGVGNLTYQKPGQGNVNWNQVASLGVGVVTPGWFGTGAFGSLDSTIPDNKVKFDQQTITSDDGSALQGTQATRDGSVLGLATATPENKNLRDLAVATTVTSDAAQAARSDAEVEELMQRNNWSYGQAADQVCRMTPGGVSCGTAAAAFAWNAQKVIGASDKKDNQVKILAVALRDKDGNEANHSIVIETDKDGNVVSYYDPSGIIKADGQHNRFVGQGRGELTQALLAAGGEITGESSADSVAGARSTVDAGRPEPGQTSPSENSGEAVSLRDGDSQAPDSTAQTPAQGEGATPGSTPAAADGAPPSGATVTAGGGGDATAAQTPTADGAGAQTQPGSGSSEIVAALTGTMGPPAPEGLAGAGNPGSPTSLASNGTPDSATREPEIYGPFMPEDVAKERKQETARAPSADDPLSPKGGSGEASQDGRGGNQNGEARTGVNSPPRAEANATTNSWTNIFNTSTAIAGAAGEGSGNNSRTRNARGNGGSGAGAPGAPPIAFDGQPSLEGCQGSIDGPTEGDKCEAVNEYLRNMRSARQKMTALQEAQDELRSVIEMNSRGIDTEDARSRLESQIQTLQQEINDLFAEINSESVQSAVIADLRASGGRGAAASQAMISRMIDGINSANEGLSSQSSEAIEAGLREFDLALSEFENPAGAGAPSLSSQVGGAGGTQVAQGPAADFRGNNGPAVPLRP